MKVLLIGGTHPRHLYYANEITRRFDVAGALLQARSKMVPAAPEGTSSRDAALWRKHFNNRAHKEAEYFGDPPMPKVTTRLVEAHQLSGEMSADFVRRLAPDVALVFGCGMIREPLLSALPEQTYNLHLGLSPRYRGAATLFWPFYFLEPNWAGTTLHKIVHEPDAGEIVHQTRPRLEWGDTIHDVACRAVVTATADVLEVLQRLEIMGHVETHRQRSTGKNFLAADFQPAHLRMIYETYNDDIVDAYLAGELQVGEPKLRKQEWLHAAVAHN